VGETLDEMAVIVGESNEDSYLLYTLGHGPFLNSLDPFRLYYYAILGYHEP
jgi:hypothetical protein